MADAAAVIGGNEHVVSQRPTDANQSVLSLRVLRRLLRVARASTWREAAKVDFKSKLAVVKFDSAKTQPEALMKATADAGFPSTVKQVE